jgi:tetratricopeptide (TPR) repeat protein
LLSQEDYTGALADIDRNLATARKVGLKPNIAHALANRGNVLWRLGRYEDAELVLAESGQLVESAEKPDQEIVARLHLINAQMALSRGRFDVAQTEGRKALARAGEQFEVVAIVALSTIGMVQSDSGKTQAGAQSCAEAVEKARRLSTPRPLSAALLALATAQLKAGEPQAALTNATEAIARFKRSGQQESEWRALLIASQASQSLDDQSATATYAADASRAFTSLEESLGAEACKRYLQRPDVQRAQKPIAAKAD